MENPETIKLGGGYEVEIEPPSSLGTIVGVVYLRQDAGRGEVGSTASRSDTGQGRQLVIAQARRLAGSDAASRDR